MKNRDVSICGVFDGLAGGGELFWVVEQGGYGISEIFDLLNDLPDVFCLYLTVIVKCDTHQAPCAVGVVAKETRVVVYGLP